MLSFALTIQHSILHSHTRSTESAMPVGDLNIFGGTFLRTVSKRTISRKIPCSVPQFLWVGLYNYAKVIVCCHYRAAGASSGRMFTSQYQLLLHHQATGYTVPQYLWMRSCCLGKTRRANSNVTTFHTTIPTKQQCSYCYCANQHMHVNDVVR